MPERDYIDHWLWSEVEEAVRPDLPELPSAPVQQLDAVEHAQLVDLPASTQPRHDPVRSGSDSYNAWFNLAFGFQQQNQMDEAARAYTEAIKLEPDETRSRVNLAVVLQQRGDYGGARQEFERVLEREPDNAPALWNLAIVLEQDGHPEQAETVYLRLIAIQHRIKEAAFRLGYVRFQHADYGGAVEAFARCLLENPYWPAALLNLSVAQWRSGDRDAAAATLETALSQDENFVEALRLRAALAIESEDWMGAAVLQARLDKLGEKTSELAYNIGVLQHRASRYQEALRSYRHALMQDPGFAVARLNLGHTLNALGETAAAQLEWQAALDAKPELAGSYFKPVPAASAA